MHDQTSKKSTNRTKTSSLSPEKYARLRAEMKNPYRGLRQFVYAAFAASGSIGGFIFLTQLLAGQEVSATLPNFALQIGIVALMVWLFRVDRSPK